MTDQSADFSDLASGFEETPEIADEMIVPGDAAPEGGDVEPFVETPEDPDPGNSPGEQPVDPVTYYPQPGGYETLPNPEGEPSEVPYHIPEVPYGGMGGERLG